MDKIDEDGLKYIKNLYQSRDNVITILKAEAKKDPSEKMVVKKISLKNPADFNKFNQKLLKWSSLKHDNILKLKNLIIGGGRGIESMKAIFEFHERNLDDYFGQLIGSGTAMPNLEEFVCKLVVAFAYLQEKGLYHGNIAMENVLISNKGEPVVCGIRSLNTINNYDERKEDFSIKNPYYYAPEYIRQQGVRDMVRYDVFSLGILILRLTYANPLTDYNQKTENDWNPLIQNIPSDIVKQILGYSLKESPENRETFVQLKERCPVDYHTPSQSINLNAQSLQVSLRKQISSDSHLDSHQPNRQEIRGQNINTIPQPEVNLVSGSQSNGYTGNGQVIHTQPHLEQPISSMAPSHTQVNQLNFQDSRHFTQPYQSYQPNALQNPQPAHTQQVPQGTSYQSSQPAHTQQVPQGTSYQASQPAHTQQIPQGTSYQSSQPAHTQQVPQGTSYQSSQPAHTQQVPQGTSYQASQTNPSYSNLYSHNPSTPSVQQKSNQCVYCSQFSDSLFECCGIYFHNQCANGQSPYPGFYVCNQCGFFTGLYHKMPCAICKRENHNFKGYSCNQHAFCKACRSQVTDLCPICFPQPSHKIAL